MQNRRAAREAALKSLYSAEVSGNRTQDITKHILKYSTRKSGNFVNGILDAALTHLKKQNKINKKGRGLIEESSH